MIPQTDIWSPRTPSLSNSRPLSAVIDDKIYLIGASDLNIYDPKTDNWTAGASPPDPNAYSIITRGAACATTGTLAPKEILVIGGGYSPPYNVLWALDNVEVYHPENNSWSTGASMPTARSWLGVAAVNDGFYAMGGQAAPTWGQQYSVSKGIVNLNERYDPPGYGTVPPAITFFSPQNNQTYTSSNVSLTFTASSHVAEIAQLSYSLDLTPEVTVTGNTTLTDLEKGNHTLTVYATDSLGNKGNSQTISFTVTEPPTPSPTIPAETPTPTISPAASASVPEFPIWVLLFVFALVVVVAAAAVKQGRRRPFKQHFSLCKV